MTNSCSEILNWRTDQWNFDDKTGSCTSLISILWVSPLGQVGFWVNNLSCHPGHYENVRTIQLVWLSLCRLCLWRILIGLWPFPLTLPWVSGPSVSKGMLLWALCFHIGSCLSASDFCTVTPAASGSGSGEVLLSRWLVFHLRKRRVLLIPPSAFCSLQQTDSHASRPGFDLSLVCCPLGFVILKYVIHTLVLFQEEA